MMNQVDSDSTVVEKPILKFGLPRIGPNGKNYYKMDILLCGKNGYLGDVVPEHFRSLIRPKTAASAHEHDYSKNLSRSDWNLNNG